MAAQYALLDRPESGDGIAGREIPVIDGELRSDGAEGSEDMVQQQ